MKHSINELYKVKGDVMHIYSEKAIKNLDPALVTPIRSKVSQPKPFRIYDEVGSKEYRYGYTCGEFAWFDTSEEREAYRKAREQALAIDRAKRFNLEGMTVLELKAMLLTLSDDTVIESGAFKIK